MDSGPYPELHSKLQRRNLWFNTRRALALSNARRNAYHLARQRMFKISRELYLGNKGAWPFTVSTEHALNLETHQIKLAWPDLPSQFDGYRILHLTDLHLDLMDDTVKTVAACAAGHGDVDLCVITGDLREDFVANCDQTVERVEIILKAVRTRDGVLCVLGNHDGPELVAPLEALGVTVLLNETVRLRRGNDRVNFTGLDDVHMFYTEFATKALRGVPDGFSIALVHSPEIADIAAERHALYLTGHTHGGQICLPGGRPISTALRRHRRYASGLWRHGEMIGYTSRGAGASGIPVRLNCPGEVSVITLERGTASAMVVELDAGLSDYRGRTVHGARD
jgi:predicted MPP superfamily phosphohydrolase